MRARTQLCQAVEPLRPVPLLIPVRLGCASSTTEPLAAIASLRIRPTNWRTCERSISLPAKVSAVASMPMCLGLMLAAASSSRSNSGVG